MEGATCRRPRERRRGRIRAQATIEFAFVAPLFFLCFLATADAGLWAVQNSAEVSVVQQAVRLAAAAGASPVGGAVPDARSVTAAVSGRLAQALFATRVVPWCDPTPGASCAPAATGVCSGIACMFRTCPQSPAQVQVMFGPRAVALCVHENDPPPCTAAPPGTISPYPAYCADTPTVTVRLIGYVASLVPPGLGFAGSGGELATDVAATTHTLRFAP